MDAAELLERTRKLIPQLEAGAAETEQLRRVPEDTVAALQRAGLMRALQPRSWGGLELDPLGFYEAAAEVAAACPSTGWVLAVLGVHPWQLALFPEHAQRDVWQDDPDAAISSSYAPTGSVDPVKGGFRVRGRWSFSSGCDACTWVFLGGFVPNAHGSRDMRTFLLPRSDYTIDDTWHVAGLAGTGSKDIVVDDAFVPEHRTHRFLDAFQLRNPGRTANPGPLYRLPFGCVFAWGVAAPALGAAQGALDACREQMREKLSAYSRGTVAEDPFAQVHLAEAAGEITAARSEMREVWERMTTLVHDGREIPMELRVRTRFTAANVVGRSVRAVDLLFAAAGGQAIFLDNPLQRFFRDVHAMRAHFINNPDRAARLFGQTQLRPDAPPADLFL